MIYEVTHKTTYHYTAPVAQAHHLVHLAPRPHERQRIVRHDITVKPAPATRNDFIDYFGNPASSLAIEAGHSELLIHSQGVIEVSAPEHADLSLSQPWDRLSGDMAPPKKINEIEAAQYLMPSRHTAVTAELIEFARPSFPAGRPVFECARELTERIHAEFAYDGAATDIATTTDELLKIRRGVCQDFAHLGIACLRAMGLAARYVSGYLETQPPPGQPRLVGADASHAWLAVYVPGVGWAEFDPTNGCLPGEKHITLAWGRDYGDVAPLTGVMTGGGSHTLEVSVDVAPEEAEDPETTPRQRSRSGDPAPE